jgi:hypothetical protein
MGQRLVIALLVTAAAAYGPVVHAQVSVNINVLPPPVIFPAPPRVLVVPRTPVYYVPDTTYNVFVYDRHYYSFHEGAWFVAASHGGPWVYVPVDRVPRPVVAVPVRYYKVPPGHAKRMEDGRGCPPGQAKKGRC